MATAPDSETSEVRRRGRQRLIGAIAIVLLAVVFVPMVLDSEPRPERREPAMAIPPKEGAAALPAPLPPPAVAKAPEPEKATPEKTAPEKTAPEKPAPEKTAPAKIAPEKAQPEKAQPAPPAAKPATQAPRLEGFAIQVGAFRDEETLRQAREKLAAAKIAHFIERLPDGLTRLRAGPYATRDAAEKAGPALAAAGFKGQIVALP